MPWKRQGIKTRAMRIREDEWRTAKLLATSRQESIRVFVERAIRAEAAVVSTGPVPVTGVVKGPKVNERRRVVGVVFEGPAVGGSR